MPTNFRGPFLTCIAFSLSPREALRLYLLTDTGIAARATIDFGRRHRLHSVPSLAHSLKKMALVYEMS